MCRGSTLALKVSLFQSWEFGRGPEYVPPHPLHLTRFPFLAIVVGALVGLARPFVPTPLSCSLPLLFQTVSVCWRRRVSVLLSLDIPSVVDQRLCLSRLDLLRQLRVVLSSASVTALFTPLHRHAPRLSNRFLATLRTPIGCAALPRSRGYFACVVLNPLVEHLPPFPVLFRIGLTYIL